MSIKWIKIITDIFDDEKIKVIDTYPARDSIIVIWFKLMVLAGKSNNDGMLLMGDSIPYDLDMLSAVFNRDRKEIEYALSLFSKFKMIEMFDDVIALSNWQKHQNIEGLDKQRELNRKRQQKFRDRKKQKALEYKNNVTHNVTITESNGTEEEEEEEEDIDKEYNILFSVYEHYMSLNLIKHRAFTEDMKNAIKTCMKRLSCDTDHIKTLITRHAKKVEISKGCDFETKPRKLQDFLSKNQYGTENLICAEYDDEWITPKREDFMIKKEEKKSGFSDFNERPKKTNEEIMAALEKKKNNVSRET